MEPIYIQIAKQVRKQIANGELKAGDQLPTVRELAIDLHVNFNTAARAYKLLDKSGVISTQQGRGSFVWEIPSSLVEEKLHRRELDALIQHIILEARSIGYTESELYKALEFRLTSNGLRGQVTESKSFQAEE